MLFRGAESDENAETGCEEPKSTFKRADLYKMRTYRDSIPRARSVWILYPGNDFRFSQSRAVPRIPVGPNNSTVLDPFRYGPAKIHITELQKALIRLLQVDVTGQARTKFSVLEARP
jgi:hypothetical protein